MARVDDAAPTCSEQTVATCSPKLVFRHHSRGTVPQNRDSRHIPDNLQPSLSGTSWVTYPRQNTMCGSCPVRRVITTTVSHHAARKKHPIGDNVLDTCAVVCLVTPFAAQFSESRKNNILYAIPLPFEGPWCRQWVRPMRHRVYISCSYIPDCSLL